MSPTRLLPSPKVLVIDEDDESRGAYQHVLAAIGFWVVEADDVRAVPERCGGSAPDVAIVEWHTDPRRRSPKAVIDGLRALGAPFSQLPVVVFSVLLDLGDVAAELEVRHCSQPCDLDRLAVAILEAAGERPGLARSTPRRAPHAGAPAASLGGARGR